MRWINALVALTLLGACGPVSSDSASDASTAKVCDGKKDCNGCQTCAKQQLCASAVAACTQSSACIGLDQCIGLCGADQSCKQQCYGTNADGAAAYDALQNCLICQQCPSDCAGYRYCG
jgi:hypothetical protein